MKPFHPLVWPVLLVLLASSLYPDGAAAVLPDTTPPPAATVPPGGGHLLLEVGWAVPLGDLADGLDETPTGAGMQPGVELGARWRFALSPRWSLGPAVHFLDYGDASGLGTSGEEGLSSSALIYSLELLLASRTGRVQPFAGLAPCVMHRRLSGPGKDHVTMIEDTHTGLGLSARVGVRLRTFEVSAVYHIDRFASYGFFESGRELDYDWDTAVLRVGWLLP